MYLPTDSLKVRMTPPYQIKKVSDEGSSSPFISRLFMGMLDFRDQLFLLDAEGQQRQMMQAHFDQQFKPMYEAAQGTRDAAIKARELVDSHLVAIQSGEAIQYRGNQYDILATIDIPLSQAVDQLIDQSIIATKTGLQNILKDPLNLDIGFFFQNDKEFGSGINDLRTSGENDLAQYLQDVRDNWHSKLQNLRVQHEHNGWFLDIIEYRLTAPSRVALNLPTVLGMPIDDFVLKTANRVLLFIENMMVFALQRYCHQYPIFVVEIPRERRNPMDPRRFRLAPKGLDSSSPWVIAYHGDMDFI
jgi:hypothetical protein